MEQLPITTVAEIFSTVHIVTAIVLFVIAWALLKLLYFVSQWFARRFSRYRMQITGLYPVARLFVWIITVYLIIVQVFQPPANSLLALLASAGLAVGLAAQDVIRNVISGMLILFEKPFRVGDMVKIGDHYGEVVSIGLRSVQLHSFEDSLITIPNATVTGGAVSNSNSGALDEMVVTSFMVPASFDIEVVKNLAWEAAASSPYVYLKKPIVVLAEDTFNRTFLTRFTVKAYVLDVRLERVFASDVQERIKKVLLDRGILTQDLIIGALTPDDT
jgi:small-conductance mechanosensitive channel